MTLTYIFHSGFVLETEKSILIFDYWLDMSGIVPPFLKKDKHVYVFSSHFHEDISIVLSLNGESNMRTLPISFPRTSTSIEEPIRKMQTYGWPRAERGQTTLCPYGH